MIYIFHKIADGFPNNENWNSVNQFAEFIEERHKEIVSLDDYLAHGRRGIVLTFDGIYENAYHNAFPVLRKLEVPFELFVVWNTVGEDNKWDKKEPYAKFASWRQIFEMLADGKASLQSHSRNHLNMLALTDLATEEQLANPLKVPYFAYPYGLFDERVEQFTAKMGYRGALSVRAGDDSQYQLRRRFL